MKQSGNLINLSAMNGNKGWGATPLTLSLAPLKSPLSELNEPNLCFLNVTKNTFEVSIYSGTASGCCRVAFAPLFRDLCNI